MTRNEIRDEILDKLNDMVFDVISVEARENEDMSKDEALGRLNGAKEIAYIAGYVNDNDVRDIWKSVRSMWDATHEKSEGGGGYKQGRGNRETHNAGSPARARATKRRGINDGTGKGAYGSGWNI